MPVALGVRGGRKPRAQRQFFALFVCLAAITAGGCATSSQWVKVRDTPRNPLAGTLGLLSPGGPKPTSRTLQLLRRYDLEKDLSGDWEYNDVGNDPVSIYPKGYSGQISYICEIDAK